MTQKAEPVTSVLSSKDKTANIFRHLLPKLITGAVLIIVVIVAVVAIEAHRNDEIATGVCSTTLLSQAANSLSTNNRALLIHEASVIKSLNNYQQDSNCMFVVTLYYLHNDDLKNAQNSLSTFNKYYRGQSLNPLLLKYTSVMDLRNDVVVLSKEQRADAERFNELSSKPPEYKKP